MVMPEAQACETMGLVIPATVPPTLQLRPTAKAKAAMISEMSTHSKFHASLLHNL